MSNIEVLATHNNVAMVYVKEDTKTEGHIMLWQGYYLKSETYNKWHWWQERSAIFQKVRYKCQRDLLDKALAASL